MKKNDYKVFKFGKRDILKYLFGGYLFIIGIIIATGIKMGGDFKRYGFDFEGLKLLFGVFMFVVFLIFLGVVWYKKKWLRVKGERDVIKKIRYFIESNSLYEISSRTKFDKNNKEYQEKYYSYVPNINYRINNGVLSVAFRLDGSSKASKFRDLEIGLSDCFNLSCSNVIEENGWIEYIFSNVASPLNVDSKIDYSDFCDNEKMILSSDSDMIWNFRKSPHALVVGDTGSGKTYFLMYLLKCLKSINADIRIIDPKRADLFKVGNMWSMPSECEGAKIAKLLREVEEEMDKRYDDMTQIGVDYFTLGMKPLFVVFDEVMAFMAGTQDTKLVKEVNGYLMNIIAKGRQSGVFMVITMQRPDAKFLDGAIRDQLGLRLTLGNMTDDGMSMVFGSKYRDSRPRVNDMGSGLIHMKNFESSRPRDFLTPRIKDAFVII